MLTKFLTKIFGRKEKTPPIDITSVALTDVIPLIESRRREHICSVLDSMLSQRKITKRVRETARSLINERCVEGESYGDYLRAHDDVFGMLETIYCDAPNGTPEEDDAYDRFAAHAAKKRVEWLHEMVATCEQQGD